MATIRKRGNDSYEIKVSCGYGVDGKQRSQYKTWKARNCEAITNALSFGNKKEPLTEAQVAV